MPLATTIRIIGTFYRGFAAVSLFFTAFCALLFYRNGLHAFTEIFWFKVITTGMIFYFINRNQQKEYKYYQNLGLSKKMLWLTTICFDFTIFIILIILIGKNT